MPRSKETLLAYAKGLRRATFNHGLSGYCHGCKCEICLIAGREYHRKKREKHRSEISDFLRKLKDNPCTDCGKSYPFYVMQFDHRDGTIKLFQIGDSGKYYKKEHEILEELKKCDLVCSNCHAERTWKNKSWENRR